VSLIGVVGAAHAGATTLVVPEVEDHSLCLLGSTRKYLLMVK
jgi:hypothetical protein